MIRYYEIRPNREAWGTSLVIHAWVLAVLLFIPAIKATEVAPETPLELTLLDLGTPGDQVAGENDAPRPKRVAAPVRNVPVERPVERVVEPKPAAIRQAPVPASPPREAIKPRIEEVRQPDLAALAAEEERRRSVEEARRRELEEAGDRQAHGGRGEAADPPPAGGAVGAGRGATGDLAGRGFQLFEPEYPTGAAQRHSEGTVVARIRVAPAGEVVEVDLVRSAGDPDLDRAALAAFRRYRFTPLDPAAPQRDQLGQVRMKFELR
ncbi:MAG: TonB family protein [Candidatus Sericytochromatia bacterium]|nr:TonB family protein [Candidatus Tanganyikabacteria bacterium]